MARLHYQYLPPEQVTPSMDRYAEAICDTITSMWPSRPAAAEALSRNGARVPVDEAGYLISTVVAVKKRVFHDPLRSALAGLWEESFRADGGARDRKTPWCSMRASTSFTRRTGTSHESFPRAPASTRPRPRRSTDVYA